MADVKIEQLTLRSLRLSISGMGRQLGTATGIVVQAKEKLFLVSNRHVFTGRNHETRQPLDRQGGLPDSVSVSHHKTGQLGAFVQTCERLVGTNGEVLYLEHPDPNVDVAALPIKQQPEVDYYVTDPHHNTALSARITVASTVCVIGFPFGLSSHEHFPIWKTGSIACEPDVPYQGHPCFLVDAATRGGMSGSPVYAVFRGPYAVEGGGTALGSGEVSRFMGIYSGRLLIPAPIREQLSELTTGLLADLGSDLGMVWRPQVIDELLSRAT